MFPPEKCILSPCGLELWPFWPQNLISSPLSPRTPTASKLYISWYSHKGFIRYHVNKLQVPLWSRTHARSLTLMDSLKQTKCLQQLTAGWGIKTHPLTNEIFTNWVNWNETEPSEARVGQRRWVTSALTWCYYYQYIIYCRRTRRLMNLCGTVCECERDISQIPQTHCNLQRHRTMVGLKWANFWSESVNVRRGERRGWRSCNVHATLSPVFIIGLIIYILHSSSGSSTLNNFN